MDNKPPIRRHLPAVAVIIVSVSLISTLLFGCKKYSESLPAGQATTQAPQSSHHVPPSINHASPQDSLSADSIIRLTNSVRLEQGLPPLNPNHLLNMIAEARIRDMFEKQYFNHISPSGEGPGDAAQRIGYRYKRLAENIASGPFIANQKILDGWMQSPGHRKNILSVETDEIGVAWARGTINGSEMVLAVQIFGKQSPSVAEVSSQTSCIPPSPDAPGQIDRQRSELAPLTKTLTQLKEELDRDNQEFEILRKDTRTKTDIDLAVSSYNAKVQRYNQLLSEVQAKQDIIQQALNEYSTKVESYKACLANK